MLLTGQWTDLNCTRVSRYYAKLAMLPIKAYTQKSKIHSAKTLPPMGIARSQNSMQVESPTGSNQACSQQLYPSVSANNILIMYLGPYTVLCRRLRYRPNIGLNAIPVTWLKCCMNKRTTKLQNLNKQSNWRHLLLMRNRRKMQLRDDW